MFAVIESGGKQHTVSEGDQLKVELLPGEEGAAIEFIGYTADALSEEAIKTIIENPDSCDLPEEVGDQYALISYLAHKANDTRVRKAAGVLLGRFSPELSVLLARDMLRANAKFAVDPAYLAFAAKHQDFLQ